MARRLTRRTAPALENLNRINVRADSQLYFWMKELDVDQKSLTQAVKAVGPSAEKVRQYLRGKTSRS
jgi:hypothetical protein